MIDTHIVLPVLVGAASVASGLFVAVMDPTLVAGATVLVIAATAGAIVQVINAVSVARDHREAAAHALAALLKAAEENTTTNAEILKKAAIIQATTDGTHHQLQSEYAVINEKVKGMQRLIDQMEKEKQATAAMRASTDLQKAGQSAAPELANIEVNTKDTADNTARTEEKVDDLAQPKSSTSTGSK